MRCIKHSTTLKHTPIVTLSLSHTHPYTPTLTLSSLYMIFFLTRLITLTHIHSFLKRLTLWQIAREWIWTKCEREKMGKGVCVCVRERERALALNAFFVHFASADLRERPDQKVSNFHVVVVVRRKKFFLHNSASDNNIKTLFPPPNICFCCCCCCCSCIWTTFRVQLNN